jgi:uncharacterized membrane protein YbhN (UPF0104 family)
VAIAAIAFAGFMLYRTLGQYSYAELVDSVRSIPLSNLLLAGLFAAASYLCLTGFDYLALRYVGHPLPWHQAALTSFTALSIGHNVGLAALSSGAVRYRFYSRRGLSAEEIAKVVLFCALTVGIGLVVLAGVALLVRVDLATRILKLPTAAVIGIGIGCLVATGLYLGLAAKLRRPLRIRRWSIEMPAFRLAVGQVVIGPLNFACVAGCLYQTLSALSDVEYLAVAAVYVIATVATLITHAPGGLGVIEAVVIHLVPGTNLIGALLAFRFVYFLVPLGLGLPLFAACELAQRASQPAQGGEPVADAT